MPFRVLLSVCLVATAVTGQNAPETENWPQFRGDHARGIATGAAAPTTWDVSTGKNVLWKTPVRGMAHSSPVVWGDRVFVMSAARTEGESKLSSLFGSKGYGAGESVANEKEHEFIVACLDKRTGKLLWQKTARRGIPRTKRHPKASHANATPACTADRVVAFFGSEGLYCYDHHGNLQWERDFGFLNVGAPGYPDKDGYQWGFASSPVIHGDRVVIQCDHEGESFVAALELATGKTIWRKPREENSTWCSPTVHETGVGGRPQVIVNGYKHIGGYDLETGEETWKLVGGGDVPVPTPVVVGDLIYLTSAHGRDRPLRALKVTASGDIKNDPDEDDDFVWLQRRRGIYMQTPLIHGGLLYACSDGGSLACYDALTGERHYRERLGAGRTGFSGSAVFSGGHLYFSGESGEISVVKAGKTFELVATNDMGETCMATPAVSDGVMFIRTRRHLVALKNGARSSDSSHDWRGFRGTDATATAKTAGPLVWNDTKNLSWKRRLPGPGASSPIVVGDAVFVTCWSGYAEGEDPKGGPANGKIEDLRRHLFKLDRRSGDVKWSVAIAPAKTEDEYGGRLATHGYASSTPVSDGELVYVQFGKSGVFAFDFAGNQKWMADIGKGSSEWKTGSGSSPSLWKDFLFVNASDESHALIALDKRTGKEIWRKPGKELDQAYGMPLLVDDGEHAPVLVLALLGEIWGLEPDTGKVRWSVKTKTQGAYAPSVIAHGSMIYAVGARGRERGYAVRLGGTGDVTDTHVEWKTRYGMYVPTALHHDGHLYWVDEEGRAYCLDAENGELVYRERLDEEFYASPMLAGDSIYYVSRTGGTFILPADPRFEVKHRNVIESDDSQFDASPVMSQGQLFLRSDRFVYCFSAK